jgi:hypothetical protein
MGPAVLVTLGVLFLLANRPEYPFERTWPILLIVIGAIKVVRYVLPDKGHVNPGQYPPPYPGTGQPPPYAGGYGASVSQAVPTPVAIVTPPPQPIAGRLGDGLGDNPGDGKDEVNHG